MAVRLEEEHVRSGEDLAVALTFTTDRAATVTRGVAAFDRNVRLVLGSLTDGRRLPTDAVVLASGVAGSSYRQRIIFRTVDSQGRRTDTFKERSISSWALVAAAILLVAGATAVSIVRGDIPPELIPEVLDALSAALERLPGGTAVEVPADQ